MVDLNNPTTVSNMKPAFEGREPKEVFDMIVKAIKEVQVIPNPHKIIELITPKGSYFIHHFTRSTTITFGENVIKTLPNTNTANPREHNVKVIRTIQNDYDKRT